MNNKELFKQAHKMAKEIKTEYPEVNYKFQFSLCLTYLREEEVKEEKVTWETVAKAADEYCEGYTNGWYANWHCNNWIKGAHNRTYIEIREYRNGSLRCVKKCGYWDNVKEEYVAVDRYTKVLDLLA